MRKILLTTVFMLAASGATLAQQRFVATLTGSQEVPAVATTAKGTCTFVLNAAQNQVTATCTFSGLTSNASIAHTHGNAVVGVTAPVLFNYTGVPQTTSGTIGPLNYAVTAQQVADMRAHLHYANIHSVNFPGGEIRGQIKQVTTAMDNDGDGRSDITVYRQSATQFFIRGSLTGGISAAPVVGAAAGENHLNNTFDFDGDGRSDPLLIRIVGTNALWTIFQTDTGTIRTVTWGDFTAANGETLAIADYDGDGKEDIAIYRRAVNTFFILESSTNQPRTVLWGTGGSTGDQPAVGDFDGDGKADPTVVRTESGNRVWYTQRSSDGAMTRTPFGASATDGFFFFAPIDIDGDGKQDISVNRNVSGQRFFFTLRSSDGVTAVDQWGLASPADVAIFGDYDGDGKTDLVAKRSTAGQFEWFIRRSSDNSLQYALYGITADQ
jgi:hypothetical protein